MLTRKNVPTVTELEKKQAEWILNSTAEQFRKLSFKQLVGARDFANYVNFSDMFEVYGDTVRVAWMEKADEYCQQEVARVQREAVIRKNGSLFPVNGKFCGRLGEVFRVEHRIFSEPVQAQITIELRYPVSQCLLEDGVVHAPMWLLKRHEKSARCLVSELLFA